MAINSNRFKNLSDEEGETGGKKKKKKAEKGAEGKKNLLIPAFLRNEKFHRIFGLLLLLFSFFLVMSFISHLIYWQEDYSIVKDAKTIDFITNPSLNVHNSMGKFGALMAYIFFHEWFGIAAIIIPFYLFLVSFKLFFSRTLLPFGKTLAYSLFVLIYLPLVCSYLFRDEFFLAGGGLGYTLYQYLYSLTGNIGVALILVFTGLTFSIIAFNFKITIPETSSKVTVNEEEPEMQTNTLRNVSLEINPQESEEEEAIFSPEDSSITESFSPILINEPDDQQPLQQEVELTVNNLSEIEENHSVASTEATISPDDMERMNLKEVLSENEEFDLGDYDPSLDLSHYKYPSLDLLENYSGNAARVEKAELEANSKRIMDTLRNYNIEIAKIGASIGPTVTLYEIVPAPGVRISRIKNLEDDIALSLAALGIRIIAPMPGKGTIGIEVPNQNPEIVSMKTLLASEKFQNTSMDLPIALGKTISNENFVADLAKMPHLLMAGATGQGKSVGLNAVLVSLLYKKHPSQIKFVLVDPKKVELTLFTKIEKHFLAKLPNNEDAIITDTKKVIHTLNSLCILMDQRYDLLKLAMVKNIKEYNAKFINRKLNPRKGHHFMPYIVLVVDEFADLIMTAGKEVELPIARLAQLARAIGIHLIIATQRPSVNIITGTIKANFPARIAFRVSSKIDSRTILDSGGAEQLIGRGDMLLSTGSDLIRLQCPFVDTTEVERINDCIGNQQGYASAFELPEYVDLNADPDEDFDSGDRDSMFVDAAHIVVMHQQGSASLLQRKLKLGYNRAGRIIDQLEKAGIIGAFEGSKARKVLIKDSLSLEQFLSSAKND